MDSHDQSCLVIWNLRHTVQPSPWKLANVITRRAKTAQACTSIRFCSTISYHNYAQNGVITPRAGKYAEHIQQELSTAPFASRLQHFQHELTGMHGFFDELGDFAALQSQLI